MSLLSLLGSCGVGEGGGMEWHYKNCDAFLRNGVNVVFDSFILFEARGVGLLFITVQIVFLCLFTKEAYAKT